MYNAESIGREEEPTVRIGLGDIKPCVSTVPSMEEFETLKTRTENAIKGIRKDIKRSAKQFDYLNDKENKTRDDLNITMVKAKSNEKAIDMEAKRVDKLQEDIKDDKITIQNDINDAKYLITKTNERVDSIINWLKFLIPASVVLGAISGAGFACLLLH